MPDGSNVGTSGGKILHLPTGACVSPDMPIDKNRYLSLFSFLCFFCFWKPKKPDKLNKLKSFLQNLRSSAVRKTGLGN